MDVAVFLGIQETYLPLVHWEAFSGNGVCVCVCVCVCLCVCVCARARARAHMHAWMHTFSRFTNTLSSEISKRISDLSAWARSWSILSTVF